MSLLGLELSDAGILVAGSEPAGLLKVDGNSVESPGFALPEKIPVRFSITSGIN
jgi:hypothetical protein